LIKRTTNSAVTCYKICKRTSSAIKYMSLVQQYQYTMGVIQPRIKDFPQVNPPHLDNPEERQLLAYSIGQGFHSYAHMPSAKGLESNCIIIKCLIPKGSNYYYSKEHDEYVSDKIMLSIEIENPNGLLAKLQRLLKL